MARKGVTLIELIWTITPALILIAIAFPSFRLLYLLDEVISPTITIKVVGLFIGGLNLYILNKMKDTNFNGKIICIIILTVGGIILKTNLTTIYMLSYYVLLRLAYLHGYYILDKKIKF